MRCRKSGSADALRSARHDKRSNIEIAFTDNGTGVTDTERIFDPFYTTKQAGKGTGLGLSICYGIVRAHGGEILCWNNEDGPGSTFIVRVPVATEAAPAASRQRGGTMSHAVTDFAD